jgi:2-oxoisovalerate dehydrogenase E1 component
MPAKSLLLQAYSNMCLAHHMANIYEANKTTCRYVHSTSRGHEAIQLATAMHLKPCDWVSPYYRDESILLGLGFEPYDLMLQLLAKSTDQFSGGRSYYSHPSYNGNDKPKIIHQSSATGMQAIPTTGIAQGLRFLKDHLPLQLKTGPNGENPIVVCSLGDASITECEVSEALQFAALKQLPIIFLVQDNDWGISVTASEARTFNAFEFIKGFKGIKGIQLDGTNFITCYDVLEKVISEVRLNSTPYLVHAQVPLIGHHTSGVRREFYRSEEELGIANLHDPRLKLEQTLRQLNVDENELKNIFENTKLKIEQAFEDAKKAPNPQPNSVTEHVFAPTPVTEAQGVEAPAKASKIVMVDAALYAIRELMQKHPEVVLYGQDVGRRLGGVFREAATLAEQFGDHRVFNTAIPNRKHNWHVRSWA